MIGDRIDNDIVPAKQLGMKNDMDKTGIWKFVDCNGRVKKPILKLITYLTF